MVPFGFIEVTCSENGQRLRILASSITDYGEGLSDREGTCGISNIPGQHIPVRLTIEEIDDLITAAQERMR